MDYNILFNLANFVNADNVGKSQMFPVQCLHGIHNILEINDDYKNNAVTHLTYDPLISN